MTRLQQPIPNHKKMTEVRLYSTHFLMPKKSYTDLGILGEHAAKPGEDWQQ